MSPLGRRRKHEKIEAWRTEADAELSRVRALGPDELAAEVMSRGFDSTRPDTARTRIGLANTLCPEAPPVVGGDDVDVVREFGQLVEGALVALERAGLLSSRAEGKSALLYYRLTDAGATALAGGDVAARLRSPAD